MSEVLKLLNRSATSLTLMLMGYDRELDSYLKQLRNILRDKEFHLEQFNTVLNELETTFDSLDGLPGKSIQTFSKTFQALLDEEAQVLLEPLNREHPVLMDLLNLAEPLSKEISILKGDRENSIDSKALEHIRMNLGQRFKTLLQTLKSLGDRSEKSTQLLAKLTKTPKWEELESIANEAIDLLQIRLNDDKSQFEGYLAELNAKLNRITEIVEADSSTLADLNKINVEFSSSINIQMKEARQKIDENHNVEHLKHDLLKSLDNIANRLEEYQNTYGSKLDELQDSKIQMNLQVQALEKENISLIAELHKERKLSMMDTLTQLPNRQGFNNRLEEELSRAERYSHKISIGILDIDFFKRINDQFGHLVGDKVLKMIAKEMNKVCRDSDFLARFGGEEFILLLPETDINEAYQAVEKIRSHIANCPFHFQNKPVPITISAGIAERQSYDTTESWIGRADAGLYCSKGNGRNQVTIQRQLVGI